MTLVEGRVCGDCTLCCTLLSVDTPQIQKVAGATCRHCIGGCAIHDIRPQVCRGFYCAWRMLPILGPEWRPDISGVFAQMETDDIPAAFATRTGIGLMLVDNPRRTVRQRWFQEFVATGIMGGIPLFLSVPGPRGHRAAKLLLNTDAMREAMERGRVKEALEKAVTELAAFEFVMQPMTNSGNDVARPD